MSRTSISRSPVPSESPFAGDIDADETRLVATPASRSPGSPESSLDIGRMLKERFVLIQQLGESGMGRVFKPAVLVGSSDEAARASAIEASARNFGVHEKVAPEPAGDPTTRSFTQSERAMIQKRLQDLGYHDGNLDANFGPATRDAIACFQAQNDFVVTGSLTPPQVDSLLHAVRSDHPKGTP